MSDILASSNNPDESLPVVHCRDILCDIFYSICAVDIFSEQDKHFIVIIDSFFFFSTICLYSSVTLQGRTTHLKRKLVGIAMESFYFSLFNI